MNTTVEINIQENDVFLNDYVIKIKNYCNIFFDARTDMELRKTLQWVLTLDELNNIFKNFNIQKQELITYYSSLESDKAKEYLNYLSKIFATSNWPQKRCIWEVIAGINNYILNNYKA